MQRNVHFRNRPTPYQKRKSLTGVFAEHEINKIKYNIDKIKYYL